MSEIGELIQNGDPMRGSTFPLSLQQKRLWFVHQLFPDIPLYNGPVVYEIRGELNVPALEAAVRMLVSRQASLRTGFTTQEDAPVQRVVDEVPFDLPVHDLCSAPGSVWDRLRQAACRPFDLSRPGLFDLHLFQVAPAHAYLLLNLHHIITDGWSDDLLVEELEAYYADHCAARGVSGHRPEVQYVDYALRQQERLEAGAFDTRLEYWARELADAPEVMKLPTDRARPLAQSFRGDAVDVVIPRESVERIQTLTKSLGVSQYMALLAVFNVLLHRYTGESDLIVGSPITDRGEPSLERTIGFFVNMIPLRSRYSPGQSFSDYLRGFRTTCVGAFRNQEASFEDIVQQTNVQGGLSHNPLVQVAFSYQHKSRRPLELSGLEVREHTLSTGYVPFELEMDLTISRTGGLEGSMSFNTDLFDRETAQRLGANFCSLLDEVSASPDLPLAAYRVFSAQEQQVMAGWNRTGMPFPADRCLHELFEDQATMTPDFVAVVCGEERLTYSELDTRAAQLASYLRGRGVGPDVVVGVRVERSLRLVVALLGVLKAGGAYLPLDPNAPEARVRQILDDAGCSILLVAQAAEKIGDGIDGIDVIDLCADEAEIAAGAVAQAALSRGGPAVRPENLVSVYYTSGSTGRPKGVASRHLGWVNRMAWMQREYGLRPGESVLHKTTLTFDDSALEIFWPLSVGGRVAVLEPGAHRDPRAILTAVERHESVYLQVVPSMLNAMLDVVEEGTASGALRTLRNTTSSGEALDPGTVARFLRLFPGALHNTWGATEVSIDSTHHVCGADDGVRSGVVGVGRPFDNNTVYVLSPDLRPVPIGAVGELYIGGSGLARGYLNAPARTAEMFLPNPFVDGERMYRTGDRGFFRADGRIEFVGRTDNQIKIRGMRVELGEVESVLQRHPAVRDAVVLLHATGGEPQRLVAFVVPRTGVAVPTPAELRSHAGRWLPEYMVPSRVVIQDEFALNTNGKIDRAALRPSDVPGQERDKLVPCEGPLEHFVADVWRELLGVGEIGALDGFFDLGGHSLLAVQFTSRIRRRIGVELPLIAVYAEPTVRALAAEVEKRLVERLEDMTDGEAARLLDGMGQV